MPYPMVSAWLLRLLSNPVFRAWLLKTLGPGGIKAFQSWLQRGIRNQSNRRGAIEQADQVGGEFSVARIRNSRHVVVWKNGQPIAAYPEVEGDLAVALAMHERDDLRSPENLRTRRAKRWVSSKAGSIPAIGRKHAGSATSDTDSDGTARWSAAIGRMAPLLNELRAAPEHRVADHPELPSAAGIYLFTFEQQPIYVGQSRNLKRRLRDHTDPNSKHNKASFAYNLALRDARAAGVTLAGTRAAIETDPTFASYFTIAKAQVAAMAVQVLALDDPIERTMFEIYAALSLGTDEFNSFETH